MFHNNLGNLLTDQKRFDEAIEHFQDALRVRPDYADAHLNLGVALRAWNDWMRQSPIFKTP